ncbi:MAG: ATP synthase F1 subunit delta [Acidimicrobiales bacterium]
MSDRVDAYADALFEVAKAEGALEAVEDELFKVARTFEANEQLRSTLTDSAIPVERRLGIVEDLLGGKAAPITTALVSFVVAAGRGRDLPAIIDKLVEKAAAERKQVVAEVRAAISLDAATIERLAAALSTATCKSVSVKVIVDQTVLGGVIARIGDTVLDGSVRHRLDQLKEAI